MIVQSHTNVEAALEQERWPERYQAVQIEPTWRVLAVEGALLLREELRQPGLAADSVANRLAVRSALERRRAHEAARQRIDLHVERRIASQIGRQRRRLDRPKLHDRVAL